MLPGEICPSPVLPIYLSTHRIGMNGVIWRIRVFFSSCASCKFARCIYWRSSLRSIYSSFVRAGVNANVVVVVVVVAAAVLVRSGKVGEWLAMVRVAR